MARSKKTDPFSEEEEEELAEEENFDSRGLLKDGDRIRVPLYMRDGVTPNPRLSPAQRAKAEVHRQTQDAAARRFGLSDALQLHKPGFRRVTDAAALERSQKAYADYDAADAVAYKQTHDYDEFTGSDPNYTGTGAPDKSSGAPAGSYPLSAGEGNPCTVNGAPGTLVRQGNGLVCHLAAARMLPQPLPNRLRTSLMTRKCKMPGAATNDLLRSCSWHAEKQFRKRGNFPSVIWLTEKADGTRQLFETGCDAPESVASDAEVLIALAEEMRQDFAATGVVRFAVAYLAKRVTVIRPVDSNATTMQPTTTKRSGVVIELHSPNEHLSIFREIIKPPRGKPILGAATELASDTQGSPYAGVLQRAASAAGVTLW